MEDSPDLIVDDLESPIKDTADYSEGQSALVSDEALMTTENIPKPTKHVKLPISKIKHIMKIDPDVTIIQQDAVFLVCKATEMFIEYLARETNKQLASNKRKTLMRRDVDVTIESKPQLCFLDGAME